jgi:ABC-type multidrug transport system permease subunit
MRTLLLVIGKDLLLLWRDRAALVFLAIAPIAVISVAGFSLASLYGADPKGETAYVFPLMDEDGGALARRLEEAAADESALEVRSTATREEAAALVREKKAGTALVIPRGTEDALAEGRPASLLLYVDPVKYLERLNVRLRLLELRDRVATLQADAARDALATQRDELVAELEQMRGAALEARSQLERASREAESAREAIGQRLRETSAAREQAARESLTRELGAARAETQAAIDARISSWRDALARYATTLAETRAAFEAWFAELERRAGSRAADIPPPPSFPEPPPELAALLAGASHESVALPALPDLAKLAAPPPNLTLPTAPKLPRLDLPAFELPTLPPPPGSLRIEEINLDGGSTTINTFDQNVPGFSVTFLLLGLLLGVSLGLIDERDWGTLDRLRAMPMGVGAIVGGKLVSRFLVGCAQMVLLLAVGWLAFGVSLGPAPWALLLPVVGIVFAGTAFGLVVAAVAPGRDSVLPVGSIVIVTMAAVGGCWWPIDLEPRWMRSVALAFPTTWAMEAFNDLMIRRRGATAAFVPTLVMLAYGGLYLAVGLGLFHRKLRRGAA